ncbi:MAG: Multifunctional fusion protein [Bacteroidota bacterium]|nr:Multifunctional fusion protein [Bacteroidota bacterium]
MKKAIYAFSGDPITIGHMDLIERASKVFDEVIAAIGANPGKQYIFGLDERVKLAQDALAHLPNVSVTSFTGLLADFAYENDVRVIIRGLRNSEDFNFELMLHQLGESQVEGIETFLLPCKQQLAHISSSAAKALQLEQGLIHEFVPMNVKQKLEERISGQLIIGVTGEAASGKSEMVKKILAIAEREGAKAFSVDFDKLGHRILERSTEAVYRNFRARLITQFGDEIRTGDDFIDSKKLGEKIFAEENVLQEFNKLIYPPLLLLLRKELYHKRGLILIESSLLAETNSLFYCNNHVIVTKCTRNKQLERLKARSYSDEKISQRLRAQFSFDKKVETIQAQIKKDRFGRLIVSENAEEEAETIFKSLQPLLPAMAVAW